MNSGALVRNALRVIRTNTIGLNLSVRRLTFSSSEPRVPHNYCQSRKYGSSQTFFVSSRSRRHGWAALLGASALTVGATILFRGKTADAEEPSDAVLTADIRAQIAKCLGTVGSSLALSEDYLKLYFPHLYDDSSLKMKIVPFDYGSNVASIVDHTLLKANATEKEIVILCKEAAKNKFAAVCVNGSRAELSIRTLKQLPEAGTVKVAVVVGFPLGASTSVNKAAEAAELFSLGVDEVDMVINIGQMKDRNFKSVYEDIQQVVEAARRFPNKVVKVIFETCLLTEEEICIASILSVLAGADFVKTSTGFSTGGATLQAVSLMKLVVGDRAFVKASGGVRTYKDSLAMVQVGAARIGTSSGVAIAQGSANTTGSGAY